MSYHRDVLITLLKWCSEDRVRKGADKLTKHMGAKQQGRLDGFFKVQPDAKKDSKKAAPAGKGVAKGKKRKVCRLLDFRLSDRFMQALQAAEDEDGVGSSKKKKK